MTTRTDSGSNTGNWLSAKSKMHILCVTGNYHASENLEVYKQYYELNLFDFLDENAAAILAVIDDADWPLTVWKRLLQTIGPALPQLRYEEFLKLLAVYDDNEDRFDATFKACLKDLVWMNAEKVAAWLIEEIKVEDLVAYTDYVNTLGARCPGLLFKVPTMNK